MKIKYIFYLYLATCFYACSNDDKHIEILSMKKEYNFQIDSSFCNECSNWQLTKDEVLEIILNSEVISSHEIDYIFNTLPCQYTGEIEFKKVKYQYTLNSGSYCILFNKDTSIYFGYFKKSKMFITPPGLQN